MIYRRLDSNGFYTFGNGTRNFLSGRLAVAQAIQTKLKLLMGEWWADTKDGLPFFQSIAGYAGKDKAVVDRIITDRILQTPNVTGILNISSSYTASTRTYTYTCWVNTAYGVVIVTNNPPVTPPSPGPVISDNALIDSDGKLIMDDSGNYIVTS